MVVKPFAVFLYARLLAARQPQIPNLFIYIYTTRFLQYITMKLLSVFFLIYSATFMPVNFSNENPPQGKCAMAVTYAEMAFKDFKKAYKSNSIEEAKKLIKTGVKKATQSSAYAIIPDCNCDNAKNYALNAVTFGNKALKADDLDALKESVKKAMDASLDVLSAISGCK